MAHDRPSRRSRPPSTHSHPPGPPRGPQPTQFSEPPGCICVASQSSDQRSAPRPASRRLKASSSIPKPTRPSSDPLTVAGMHRIPASWQLHELSLMELSMHASERKRRNGSTSPELIAGGRCARLTFGHGANLTRQTVLPRTARPAQLARVTPAWVSALVSCGRPGTGGWKPGSGIVDGSGCAILLPQPWVWDHRHPEVVAWPSHTGRVGGQSRVRREHGQGCNSQNRFGAARLCTTAVRSWKRSVAWTQIGCQGIRNRFPAKVLAKEPQDPVHLPRRSDRIRYLHTFIVFVGSEPWTSCLLPAAKPRNVGPRGLNPFSIPELPCSRMVMQHTRLISCMTA
jgi:hypothetical protein